MKIPMRRTTPNGRLVHRYAEFGSDRPAPGAKLYIATSEFKGDTPDIIEVKIKTAKEK